MQPLFIVQQQPFAFGLTTHDALVLLNQVCFVHSLRLGGICQPLPGAAEVLHCFRRNRGRIDAVPAPQPNAYWHMDATRGLVKDTGR